MNPSDRKHLIPHFQRYLLTGLLAFIPLWVTWIIFEFVLIQLSRLGRPFVSLVASLFAASPTCGSLEIVPVADMVPTDWSLDEAMTFIVTGGALAPDRIKYTGAPDDRMP